MLDILVKYNQNAGDKSKNNTSSSYNIFPFSSINMFFVSDATTFLEYFFLALKPNKSAFS